MRRKRRSPGYEVLLATQTGGRGLRDVVANGATKRLPHQLFLLALDSALYIQSASSIPV